MSQGEGTRTSVHRFTFSVRRSPDEVFEYLTDPSRLTQWLVGVTSVQDAPRKDDISQGLRIEANVRILGVRAKATAEFDEFDRESRRAVVTQRLPRGGQIQSHLAVDGLDDAAIAHFEHEITVPEWLLARLELSAIAKSVEHAANHSHANVVNILESDAVSGLASVKEELEADYDPERRTTA